MKFWNRFAGFSLAIVVICAAQLASAQEPTAGVVRISDLPAVGEQMKMSSYNVYTENADPNCETQTSDCDTSDCGPSGDCKSHEVCLHKYTLRNIYWHFKYSHPWCCFGHCHDDCDYKGHGHKGYDCPPQNCPYCRNGKHCPHHGRKGSGHKARRGVASLGYYTIAYPVNPEYCDDRDGQLYAAQGYGINVSVPLAPNVGAVYNYGWGVPSSRLTQISNPLPVPPISSTMYGPSPIVIRSR